MKYFNYPPPPKKENSIFLLAPQWTFFYTAVVILQLCFCSYGVFQAGWLELQKLRMRGFEITSADWKIFFDEIDKWEDLEDGFPMQQSRDIRL
ncbi:MAG: hypothetical protein IKL96_10095 [Kiritimatiellae bacterium]|nr:hypothetical protein [Kiritimatiellia bacterium]